MPIHGIKFENDMTVTEQTPIGLILQYFIDAYIFFRFSVIKMAEKKKKENSLSVS